MFSVYKKDNLATFFIPSKCKTNVMVFKTSRWDKKGKRLFFVQRPQGRWVCFSEQFCFATSQPLYFSQFHSVRDFSRLVQLVYNSVASSMKNSSIERARACWKIKFRARVCSSIGKFCMIELLPGYLTENALFLPKFAYFQMLVCIEH